MAFLEPRSLKKCPNCGNNMLLRQGKSGFFAGCASYPNCKSTFNINLIDMLNHLLSIRESFSFLVTELNKPPVQRGDLDAIERLTIEASGLLEDAINEQNSVREFYSDLWNYDFLE